MIERVIGEFRWRDSRQDQRDVDRPGWPVGIVYTADGIEVGWDDDEHVHHFPPRQMRQLLVLLFEACNAAEQEIAERTGR